MGIKIFKLYLFISFFAGILLFDNCDNSTGLSDNTKYGMGNIITSNTKGIITYKEISNFKKETKMKPSVRS